MCLDSDRDQEYLDKNIIECTGADSVADFVQDFAPYVLYLLEPRTVLARGFLCVVQTQ